MYRDVVVSAFAGRHRLVRDTLRALVGWQRARRVVAGLGLDPAATPWEVSFACWLDLFELFKAAARQRMPSGVAGAERRLLRQQRRLRKPHRTSSWSSSKTLSSVVRRHLQSAIPPVRSFRAAAVLGTQGYCTPNRRGRPHGSFVVNAAAASTTVTPSLLRITAIRAPARRISKYFL